MPGIQLREQEPVEVALRKFKKQTERSGVLADVRRKDYFEKPSIMKKKKSISARKRAVKTKRKLGMAE